LPHRGNVTSDDVILKRHLAICLGLFMLGGCAEGVFVDRTKDDAIPAMGWDARPEAAVWTGSTLSAVARNDSVLAGIVPADIAAWCPGYGKANLEDRRAFWVGLLSALAKHESSWNPKAAGGGGRYIGLLQISPRTAKGYGCEAQSSAALKDGAANLSCGVRIMARQVGEDGVVAGDGGRGLGRDWGPFKVASKRQAMSAWTAQQSYCQ
jgi:Transglycosylase SLT domain